MDSLMNFTNSSNQHADMLTEEKEKTEQPFELFPKGDKAQQPYVIVPFEKHCQTTSNLGESYQIKR